MVQTNSTSSPSLSASQDGTVVHLRLCSLQGRTMLNRVAALYAQHFLINRIIKQRERFITSLLSSRYQEFPACANFATCRTLVLLLLPSSSSSSSLSKSPLAVKEKEEGNFSECPVVTAATVRLHKTSMVRFLEVILFATHQAYQKRGFGGLLSSVLIKKAKEANCHMIVLRSSNTSVFFWNSQGYQPFDVNSPGSKSLMFYVKDHCLLFPETVLMQRTLSSATFSWIEYSLGKCTTPTILEDFDASITPIASRLHSRSFHDTTTGKDLTEGDDNAQTSVSSSSAAEVMALAGVPFKSPLLLLNPQERGAQSYEGIAAPQDPETRLGCGLYDNRKLTSEEIDALTVTTVSNTNISKGRRRGGTQSYRGHQLRRGPGSGGSASGRPLGRGKHRLGLPVQVQFPSLSFGQQTQSHSQTQHLQNRLINQASVMQNELRQVRRQLKLLQRRQSLQNAEFDRTLSTLSLSLSEEKEDQEDEKVVVREETTMERRTLRSSTRRKANHISSQTEVVESESEWESDGKWNWYSESYQRRLPAFVKYWNPVVTMTSEQVDAEFEKLCESFLPSEIVEEKGLDLVRLHPAVLMSKRLRYSTTTTTTTTTTMTTL